MIIISHRGNIDGPSEEENHPDRIDKCISLGYDVEIDVRYDYLNIPCLHSNIFWLGHDDSQYKVSWKWISNRLKHLWIHCKDIMTLYEFSARATPSYQYFWHQGDDFTLTSGNNIWTYPGNPCTSRSIMVMPEETMDVDKISDLKVSDCYGICTDYPSKLK